MIKCRKCNAELPDNANFCSQCGEVVNKIWATRCTQCGTLNEPNAKFCIHCGSDKLRQIDKY